mmetsp:Transcript_64213/g.178381  ORF Transcript_64213/g.178381 Transcript_64213/m.178381 type:complete len:427 (+) Transcript_64213:97-1377(+)
MVHCHSVEARERRLLRARERGFLRQRSFGHRYVAVEEGLHHRVLAFRNSIRIHDAHNKLTGTPTHYARHATLAATTMGRLSLGQRDDALRAHRAANRAKHRWRLREVQVAERPEVLPNWLPGALSSDLPNDPLQLSDPWAGASAPVRDANTTKFYNAWERYSPPSSSMRRETCPSGCWCCSSWQSLVDSQNATIARLSEDLCRLARIATLPGAMLQSTIELPEQSDEWHDAQPTELLVVQPTDSHDVHAAKPPDLQPSGLPDAQPTELPVVHPVEFPVVNPIKHAESPDALLEPRVGSCVFLDSQPAVLLGASPVETQDVLPTELSDAQPTELPDAPDGDLIGKLAAQTVDLPDEVLRRQFLSEASQLLSAMKAANMPAVSDDISQCQYIVDCLIAATSQVDLVSSWGKFLATVDDIRTRDYLRDS